MKKREKEQQKTVFVGLSGGVDSSVAALLLIQQGYNVVGVFIKVWQPPFLTCDWEAERLSAMRAAAMLGIPFLTLDAADEYKHHVADYFIQEYRAGRTPNPDIMCNTHVKFGSFLDFAKKRGAAYIATGHYARRMDEAGSPRLYRGADLQKDQSYFLWNLSSEQISHALFPIGELEKHEVRSIARRAKLPTADKKDSQGVCFLGELDMKEFLLHYIDTHPGDVLDGAGNVIGKHDGACLYTIGQRHGVDLTTKTATSRPHYVISKDVAANTITVAEEKPKRTVAAKGGITLVRTNWLDDIPDGILSAQMRYQQEPIPVRVEITGESSATVTPEVECDLPASGQSCVVYADAECLGGGIVSETDASDILRA